MQYLNIEPQPHMQVVCPLLALMLADGNRLVTQVEERAILETTQGQMDGFVSQFPFKCYLPEVASVGD